MTYYVPSFYHMRRRMLERMLSDQNYSAESVDVYFPVDVKVENDAYVISALLPGVKADDINIRIVDTTITIEGEISNGRDDKENYLLAERPGGKFRRILNLPDALNAGNTEAHLVDGVLTLRVAKAEEAQPKLIKVVSK